MEHNISDFFVGDSLSLKVVDDVYCAKDNYTLKAVLINSTANKIEILFNTDIVNNYYAVTKTNTETKTLTPGKYKLFFVFSKLSLDFVKQIEAGVVDIKSDVIESTSLDYRTDTEKKLQAIRDLIDGRLVEGTNAFSINGRSVTLMSITELLDLQRVYEQKLDRELKLTELNTKGRTNRNRLKLKWS